MSRKLLVLAATGAMIAPALSQAENNNITFYGTLNADLEAVSARGPGDSQDVLARSRLVSNSSNFGLKGIEELTSGLKGVYQVELGFNLSSGTGITNLRNTMLGLETAVGTFSYGKWDTPFKLASTSIEPFWATGVGTQATILDGSSAGGGLASDISSGGGANATERQTFHRRQGNSVQYWSPTLYGTQLRVMYSGNADRSNSSNPDLISASLSHEQGPVSVAVAWEQHDDFSAEKTKDTGWKAAASFNVIEGTTLGAAWTNLKYKTMADAGDTSASRNAFAFTVRQAISDFTVRAAYSFAASGSCSVPGAAECSVENNGGKMLSLGGSYSLSKRTDVYALYSKIWNDTAASYNYAYNPVGTAGTAGNSMGAGADPQAFGLGIRHTF